MKSLAYTRPYPHHAEKSRFRPEQICLLGKLTPTTTNQGRINAALRLKAALWLSGRPGNPGTNEDPVVALTTLELAEREPLIRNDISKSKLDEILRLRRDAKPMELRVIAEALDLPASFLDADDAGGEARSHRDLAEALETIRVLADRLRSQS